MKLKLDLKKVISALNTAKKKIVTFCMKASVFIKNLINKINWQKVKVPAVILLVIVAGIELTFAVLVYGFRLDNKFTKVTAKIIPLPIAVVNYDFVTYNDYLNERDYIHHFYQATEQDEVSFKDIDSEITNQLIENKLVAYETLINNVHVDKQEMDGTINSIVEQNGGKDKVEKVLQELYGLTLKQFSKLVEIQLLRDKLNDKMIAKVDARHILIRVDENAPENKVTEAKTKIDNIAKEIQGGLDFAEAAKKYSEDVGSAEQGGKLDPFAKGEMVESFSNAAFATKAGEISTPVRSEFGWHLIKVEGRSGKIEKTFSEWLNSIKDKSLILKFYEV